MDQITRRKDKREKEPVGTPITGFLSDALSLFTTRPSVPSPHSDCLHPLNLPYSLISISLSCDPASAYALCSPSEKERRRIKRMRGSDLLLPSLPS